MADTGTLLFRRFSTERVTPALKDTPVCNDTFKIGVVLYDGENIVPFGEHMFAAPISCAWG